MLAAKSCKLKLFGPAKSQLRRDGIIGNGFPFAFVSAILVGGVVVVRPRGRIAF